MSHNKGYTLIEVLVVLLILGILVTIPFPAYSKLYEKYLLKTTAAEIKSMLNLAQQLSIDESRQYCVEVINGGFRLREFEIRGKVITKLLLHKRIKLLPGSHHEIIYNRDGVTGYGKIILTNNYGEIIDIQILLGTGRVKITNHF